jgi:hypothetical protein
VLHDRHGPHNLDSTCVVGTMHRRPPGDAVGTSEVLTRHSVGPNGHRSKSLLVR